MDLGYPPSHLPKTYVWSQVSHLCLLHLWLLWPRKKMLEDAACPCRGAGWLQAVRVFWARYFSLRARISHCFPQALLVSGNALSGGGICFPSA